MVGGPQRGHAFCTRLGTPTPGLLQATYTRGGGQDLGLRTSHRYKGPKPLGGNPDWGNVPSKAQEAGPWDNEKAVLTQQFAL